MEKLGVIQIIDSLNAGGAEVLAVNIANGLSEIDINSHLCVTRKKGVLESNIQKGVGVKFLNKKNTFDIIAIISLIKYLKLNNISIIHAHSTSYFFAFCIKLFKPEVKIIWHDHYGKNDRLDKRKLFPIKFCSSYFNLIISVNENLKKWANEKLKCKKVVFLNNFAQFTNDKQITILKGIKGKRIIHLAAFREQKDHINLLEAFKIIFKKHPEYSLHLVGKIHNNSYSESIKNWISIENLTESIFLYNEISDIKNVLKQSDIGVLSSKSEGLPVSLLEYGLSNLPVLITDVGQCRKVVKNENAIVVPKRSDLFANALLKIIINNELRIDISSRLNKNVMSNFSRDKFIFTINKMYNNL